MYVLRGKCDIENENDIKRFSIEDTIFSTAEYMVENNDIYESMVNPKSFYKNGYYDDIFDKNNFYDRSFRSKFDYLLDDYGEDIYY